MHAHTHSHTHALTHSRSQQESQIDASSNEGEVPDDLSGDIEFSDVMFSYPARPDVPVLRGLSVRIAAGQTVALVGPSGCGKSTTVQLIQRFYETERGQVRVGHGRGRGGAGRGGSREVAGRCREGRW